MSQVPAAQSAPQEQVFRSNPVIGVVGGIFLAALAALFMLVLIPQLLPNTVYSNTRRLIVYSAMAVVFVGVLVLMLWRANITVTVRPDRVDVGRWGKPASYPRATTQFRTEIVRHHTNGIHTNTTRALVAHSGGQEKKIALPGFGRDRFNELMAVINPVAFALNIDPAEFDRVRATVPADYTVDASAERKRMWKLPVMLIALLVAVACLVAVMLPSGTVPGDRGIYGGVLVIALLIALFVGRGAVHNRRMLKRAPAQISVSSFGIRIDGADHPWDQMTRVWLSPASYGERRIVIESTRGRSIHMLSTPTITITPDYETFLVAIRVHTASRSGLLALDLE